MNHIYKVIWNRARACWQVVPELAKSNGKTKSSRRQKRLNSALAQSALNGYKKLAAVMAVWLACSLGGAWSVACAAEGETLGGGILSYGAGGVNTKSVFTDWQAGHVVQAGNSYNTIMLDVSSAPRWVNPTNPAATLTFNAAGYTTLLNYYNSAAGGNKGYDTVIAVINVPDPANPGSTIAKTYTVASKNGGTVTLSLSYGQLGQTNTDSRGNVNKDYWLTPEIAQQIDQAIKNNDQTMLTQLISNGLPHFYVVNSGDLQNGLSLAVNNGTLLKMATTIPFKFISYPVTLPAIPSDPTYSFSYQNQTVGEGGIWRPMDRLETAGAIVGDYTIGQSWMINADGTITQVGTTTTAVTGNGSGTAVTDPTAITVKDLTVGKNGTVDLSYINTTGVDPIVNHIAYTADGSYGGIYGTGVYYTASNHVYEYERAAWRTLLVENATLGDGTIFRLGSYGIDRSLETNQTTKKATIGSNTNDQVFITNASTQDGGISKLYIQLGWVPGVGTVSQGEAVSSDNILDKPIVLGILNGADKFIVTGQASLADGIFSQYRITPVIGQLDNYFNISGTTVGGALIGEQGTAWYLDSYSYQDLKTASESGRSAADNLVVTNNLWKSNYLNMFRRVGSLHQSGYSGEPDQKENVWADVWHGQYKSVSGYDRRVDQTYNGMQVGYDKLLINKVGNGKVYTGFYLSKLEGDSQTSTGGGDQDSQGLGIYGTWVGDKGHYLDTALLASRLSNKYHLTANTGNGIIGRVDGDYDTWSYGLGLQYGYQNTLRNKWFWEPSVGLFVGHTDEANYSLSNHLGISQGGYDTVTGKLGLSVGKALDSGSNVYARVAAMHQFAGGSAISAFYGSQSMLLDTAVGKDSWWEFNLGGNRRISPAGVFNLDLSKTFGSNTGNDYRINGGFNWTWGGFWSKGKPAAADNKIIIPPRTATTVIIGQAPEAPVREEANTAKDMTVTVPRSQTELVPDQTAVAGEGAAVAGSGQSPDNDSVSRRKGNAELLLSDTVQAGEFSFPTVTVEAVRPNWEKQLSPGQVSVIYPDKFEGEQKDLPDLLERVPGLFVQRVSGDGHYTVARVRGSTGAQVNVYVDGVLMNLNGDAAVNLSTIPVDNVERIEVYRGYVPARFSGAPLGGVINIVTKKPGQIGGSISQGMKSFGGYNGTYELTGPVGSGSLMATYQRDIWGGDFPFQMIVSDTNSGEYNRRSNGYQNSNGMVKWQDDNWTVKASWKELHEELPRSVSGFLPGNGPSSKSGYTDYYQKGYYDAEQDIDQKEFQIGRRNTAGNLDWGWRLNYLDSEKNYRNTGSIRGIAAGDLYKTVNPLPGSLWADYRSQKWGGNLNGSMKLGSSHLLEFNADLSHETMDVNGSDWDNVPGYYEKFGLQLLRNYEIKEYHLNLQDTVTLNQAGDFKLTPVLRADKVEMESLNEADHKWQYSGGAALQKQFDPHWSAKTSWGTYNRHPNFYEIFGDGATIKPNDGAGQFFDLSGRGTWESGTQFDFSINWQGSMLKADTDSILTWFQRRSQNQFALWIPNVPNAPSTYYPMDNAKVHGIELTHAMKWNRLTFSLAGTWQQSEYSDSTMNGTPGTRKSTISYTPEWVWNTRLDYRFDDRLSAYAGYNYTGKQFLGSTDNHDTDNYLQSLATVDLGLKYAFAPGWKLSAGVNDIFNKGYDLRQYNRYGIGGTNGLGYSSFNTTPAYPVAGRMYYVTMECKF